MAWSCGNADSEVYKKASLNVQTSQLFIMDTNSSLWSINSTSSSFLYSQGSQSQHSQEYISLNSPDSIRDTSYAEYEDGYTSDSLDEFPVVSLSQLDARRYLYSNGISVCEGGEAVQQLKVTSTKETVDMEMTANDVILNGRNCSTDIQLMGNFHGDVTVTRIGVRAQIHYQYSPLLKVKMVVQMRKGHVGQCEDIVKLYENMFYPSASTDVGFIDHAKTVCSTARDGFCLELKISGSGRAKIKSCTVCLRAKGGKVVHVDDGEDVATRRLYW
jgi:hypothetical protein